MEKVIAAIDQGTTSTRCILFNDRGQPLAQAQQEHEQIYPQPGWVEHDPLEIWQSTQSVIRHALGDVPGGAASVLAAGITNQRSENKRLFSFLYRDIALFLVIGYKADVIK